MVQHTVTVYRVYRFDKSVGLDVRKCARLAIVLCRGALDTESRYVETLVTSEGCWISSFV